MKYEIHLGQIITTRKIIKEALWHMGHEVSAGTISLLCSGIQGQDNLLTLYSICAELETLGRMVYKGENGIKKPEGKLYDYWLFETRSGERSEIDDIINWHVEKEVMKNLTDQDLEAVYNKYQVLRAIWTRFLSQWYEIAYIPEYAYALEYVLGHDDLPMPLYKEDYYLFPYNYDDFNYTEGIATYFQRIIDVEPKWRSCHSNEYEDFYDIWNWKEVVDDRTFEFCCLTVKESGLPYDLWFDSLGIDRNDNPVKPIVRIDVEGNLIPLILERDEVYQYQTEKQDIPGFEKVKAFLMRFYRPIREHWMRRMTDYELLCALQGER